LYIHEDVTDWQDEAMREEVQIASEEDIIEEIERGRTTAQLARISIVSVLLGNAPPELLPPIKIMTQVGGQAAIISKIRSRRSKIETKSGSYQVSDYVGNVRIKTEPTDDEVDVGEPEYEPSYVRLDDPLAQERAIAYILDRIPSHVWTRLLIVHKTGGDVRQVADELIGKIREMVDKLI